MVEQARKTQAQKTTLIQKENSNESTVTISESEHLRDQLPKEDDEDDKHQVKDIDNDDDKTETDKKSDEKVESDEKDEKYEKEVLKVED